MKFIKSPFLALVATIVMASCSNNSKPAAVAQSDSASLKQQFASLTKGAWVLTDYIKEIEQTRSPLKSVDKLHGIVAVVFENEVKGDSIQASANWNNHEGFDFSVHFVAGKNPGSLKTSIQGYDTPSSYSELAYETNGKDTVLILSHYNKENKILDKKEYRKVMFAGDRNANLHDGLQYLVNQKIFVGNYIFIDKEKNAETKVTLKEDGSIAGLKGFEKYWVRTDFISGPDNSPDEICFQADKAEQQCFAFQSVQDTINIFHESKGRKPGAGQLSYRFVRLR